MLPGYVNPVIEDREVKVIFCPFDLFPGDRHQYRVDVDGREPWENRIGLCCGPRRRVPQLSAQNEKRFASHLQLPYAVFSFDLRQFLSSRKATCKVDDKADRTRESK